MSDFDIENASYRELQRMCKELNLESRGSVSVLRDRLSEYFKNGSQDDDEQQQDDAQEEEDQVSQGGDDDDDAQQQDDEQADDDEEDDEDDGAFDGDHEVLGCLVRRPRSRTRSEDDDDENAGDEDEVVFIGADAMKEAYEGALDDAMQSVAAEFMNGGDNESYESADEDEDDEYEPTLVRHGKIFSAPTAGLLALVEFTVVFFTLLIGNEFTVAEEDKNITGFEFVFHRFVDQSVDLTFWKTIFVYSLLFTVIPTLVGLILGKKTRNAESVFGFAVSRWAIAYLLFGYASVFNWDANPFLFKLFNVTTAVSLASAVWEKLSEHMV